MIQDIQLQWSGAVVLAAAALEQLPSSKLIDAGCDDWGAFVTLRIKKKIDSGFIEQLEECVRAHLQKKAPIHTHEMVGSNGQEMLRHHGFHEHAIFLKNEGLIEVAEYEGVYVRVEGECLEDAGKIGAIGILFFDQKEAGKEGFLLTLHAYTASSSKEWSKYQKTFRNLEKIGHVKQLETLDIAQIGRAVPIWLPEGMSLRHAFYRFGERYFFKNRVSIVSLAIETSSVEERAACHRIVQQERGWSSTGEWVVDRTGFFHNLRTGWLRPPVATQILSFTSSPPKMAKEVLNSSLQSIEEIIRMFGISYEWRRAKTEKGERVEMVLPDALGRKWVGPTVALTSGSANDWMVTTSLFGPIERLIAVVVEQKGSSGLAQMQEILK